MGRDCEFSLQDNSMPCGDPDDQTYERLIVDGFHVRHADFPAWHIFETPEDLSNWFVNYLTTRSYSNDDITPRAYAELIRHMRDGYRLYVRNQ